MSAPRLSKDQKTSILQDWLKGVSSREIAEKYGVDKSYPGMLEKRRGLPCGNPEQRRAARAVSA